MKRVESVIEQGLWETKGPFHDWLSLTTLPSLPLISFAVVVSVLLLRLEVEGYPASTYNHDYFHQNYFYLHHSVFSSSWGLVRVRISSVISDLLKSFFATEVHFRAFQGRIFRRRSTTDWYGITIGQTIGATPNSRWNQWWWKIEWNVSHWSWTRSHPWRNCWRWPWRSRRGGTSPNGRHGPRL